MSINQAIGNAFSGLSAAARASEIVSRNVANATTEGYSATGLARSQQVNGVEGAGVRVTGVERAGNPLLTADRRRVEASAGNLQGQAEALRHLSDLIADPDGGDSLSNRYVALENALRAFADTPESPSMQAAVAAAGRALATRFNTLSTQVSRYTTGLQDDVKQQVETVNTALKKIAQLNTSITAGKAAGRDTTALEDERDRQIEVVNGIVPIRTRDRDSGGMIVQSANGILLVEGNAREIGWKDGTTEFVVSGSPVEATGPSAGLQGGRLEATVTAISQTGTFGAQVDALAADLIERFQTLPNYDTADGLGNPLLGLFVIQNGATQERLPATGGPPSLADPAGAASLIRLNAAVDPVEGGLPKYLWQRDPADTMVTDAGGGETFPTALMTAMRSTRTSALPALVPGDYNAVDLAIGFIAIREETAVQYETEASFQQAATLSLHEQELSYSAVDTDAELRNLLRIEQAYAANARILEVTSNLINTLLEI